MRRKRNRRKRRRRRRSSFAILTTWLRFPTRESKAEADASKRTKGLRAVSLARTMAIIVNNVLDITGTVCGHLAHHQLVS